MPTHRIIKGGKNHLDHLVQPSTHVCDHYRPCHSVPCCSTQHWMPMAQITLRHLLGEKKQGCRGLSVLHPSPQQESRLFLSTRTYGWDQGGMGWCLSPAIAIGQHLLSTTATHAFSITVPLQGCERTLHSFSVQQISVSIACFGQK